jgi:preprotein translocase subunit SecE
LRRRTGLKPVAMSDKPGLMERMSNYTGEIRTEMSKVIWPTKEELKSYTIIVLVSTAIISFILWVWDLFLGRVLGFILNIGS